MPISTTFLLGPDNAYFFNTPTHWAYHGLPTDITVLFTNTTPPVQDVVELALGTSGAYFISYRSPVTGDLLCKHYNLPNPLVDWLYASQPRVVRDLATLSISLGPWDSFYAWDCTGASWSNVPPGLEKALEKRLLRQEAGGVTVWDAGGYEAPSFVSLGSDGAYFMRTVRGGGCWDFKLPRVEQRGGLGTVGGDGWEGIRGSHKFLEESSDFTGVAAVHLMPIQANAYVLVLTSGKMFSNLPERTWNDYAKMMDKLPPFVQHMAPLPPLPAPSQAQLPPQAPAQPQQYESMPTQAQHYHATPPQAQQYQDLPPNYKMSQRAGSGCCGPNSVQARPWPMPPVNAPHTHT